MLDNTSNPPKLTKTGRISTARSGREIGDAWIQRQKDQGLVRISHWVPQDKVDQVRLMVKQMSEQKIRVLSKKEVSK